MKKLAFILFIFSFAACNQPTNTNQLEERNKQLEERNKQLEERISRLEEKISNTYKPGFGELMGGIHYHHAKLWFAGVNKNWELAEFEIHEIHEGLEAIEIFQSEREESKLIGMINSPIDDLSLAIKKKNADQFKEKYTNLTKSCNECHHRAKHGFIKIKVPSGELFSNQEW